MSSIGSLDNVLCLFITMLSSWKSVPARLTRSGPRLTPKGGIKPLTLIQTRSVSRTVPAQNTLSSENLTQAAVLQVYKALTNYQWLESLVKKIPLLVDAKNPDTEDADQYFELPLGTHFRAPSREIGQEMADMFRHAIDEHGLAVIELGFDDTDSSFLLEAIEAMGCSADTHSSTQGALVSLFATLVACYRPYPDCLFCSFDYSLLLVGCDIQARWGHQLQVWWCRT